MELVKVVEGERRRERERERRRRRRRGGKGNDAFFFPLTGWGFWLVQGPQASFLLAPVTHRIFASYVSDRSESRFSPSCLSCLGLALYILQEEAEKNTAGRASSSPILSTAAAGSLESTEYGHLSYGLDGDMYMYGLQSTSTRQDVRRVTTRTSYEVSCMGHLRMRESSDGDWDQPIYLSPTSRRRRRHADKIHQRPDRER